jgi:hypothetical protein
MCTSLHVLHVGGNRWHKMVTRGKKKKKTDKAEESKTLRHSKLANMLQQFRICGDMNVDYLTHCYHKQQLSLLLGTHSMFHMVYFPTRFQRNHASAMDNIQCIRKVAVHLQKVLEVMSTSVDTRLNPFNFIRKHFLQICIREVAVH